MNITRRSALLSTSAVALLAGCGTNAATIEAQALSDAQGLVSTAKAIVAAVVQYAPTALSATVQGTIAAAENAASAAIGSLSSTTLALTGAQTLQTVDTDINTVLAAIGAALPAASVAVPALAPFIATYDAAIALLPPIETWINSVITPTAASAKAPLKPIRTVFTAAQARARLHIPVKP